MWQLINRKHTVGAHDCHMMGRRPDTVRLDQVSVGSDGTWIQHISESVLLHSTSTRGISTTRLQLQQKSATLQYKPHTSIWTHCLSLAKKYYLSTKTSLKVQGSQKLIHNKLNHTVKLNLPEVTLRKFRPGIICKTIAVVIVSATSVFGNLICLFLGTPSTYFHSQHLFCFSLPVYRLRARFILCVILVF